MVKHCLPLVLFVVLAACGEPERSSPEPGAAATREAITQEMVATQRANAGLPSATAAGAPEASATPTVAASPDTTPITPTEALEETAPTAEIAGVMSVEPAGYLHSLLPPLVAFPEGFAITREGRMNAESLSQIYLDPQTRIIEQQRLEDWGLKRAAMRFYDLLGATEEDARSRMVHARAHVLEFDTPEHAAEAIAFEHDRRLRCECSMESAAVEQFGEQVMAVHGINPDADTGLPALAIVWVRQGTVLWTIAAESLEYDSLPDAVELLKAAIAQPDDRIEVTLPWTLNLPDGFVVTREQAQSPEEVARDFEPDAAGYLERLHQWGFVQAHMRAFTHPWAADTQMDVLFAQVVEYGSPEQAAEALAFAQNVTLNEEGFSEATAQAFGDRTIAATGTQVTEDGTTREVAVVLVQISNRVYAYSGSARTYMPLPDVYRIAVDSLSRTGH